EPAHLLHLPANSSSGPGDRINLPKSSRAAAGAPCGHVFTNRGVYTLKWIIPSGKFGENRKCLVGCGSGLPHVLGKKRTWEASGRSYHRGDSYEFSAWRSVGGWGEL